MLSIEENGGIGSVCVVKRSGTIPTGGLTVELDFLFQLGQSQPSMSQESINVLCYNYAYS